jgi:hypothetical protein
MREGIYIAIDGGKMGFSSLESRPASSAVFTNAPPPSPVAVGGDGLDDTAPGAVALRAADALVRVLALVVRRPNFTLIHALTPIKKGTPDLNRCPRCSVDAYVMIFYLGN